MTGPADPPTASAVIEDLVSSAARGDKPAQEQLLDVKKREAAQINARYDDDKKRYAAINAKRAMDAKPAPSAKR